MVFVETVVPSERSGGCGKRSLRWYNANGGTSGNCPFLLSGRVETSGHGESLSLMMRMSSGENVIFASETDDAGDHP